MLFKATIELLLDTANATEAQDAIGAMMNTHIQVQDPASCLIDWQYAMVDRQPAFPVPDSGDEFDEYQDMLNEEGNSHAR